MNQAVEPDRTNVSLTSRLGLFSSQALSIDSGLLLLRIVLGTNLLLNHGLFKIPMLLGLTEARSPDPFNLGIIPTLAFSFLADGICSVLFVGGLATRFAALIMFVNLTVAWGMVHNFTLSTSTGEYLFLYWGGAIAIGLMGAGRFSLDAKLRR